MQITIQDIIKLTQFQVALLHKAGLLRGVPFDDPDVLQEGYIAGWKAYQTYDATKGTLSTWLLPRIRGAILDYVNKDANEGMGGKDAKITVVGIDADVNGNGDISGGDDSDSTEEWQDMPFTYNDSGHNAVPAEFAEPETYVDKHIVRETLDLLPYAHSSLLRAYYGIDRNALTLPAIARQWGISLATAGRRLKIAHESVRGLLKTRDT